MKKTACLFIAAFVFSFLLSAGCDLGPRGFTEEDLSEILEARWQEFKSDKPNFYGGIGLQILSPRGDYFISTGLDESVTNTSNFRIASITKTFTAAAVMLLHQDGLLDIDDRITDIIPGTNIPYVPDTPEYDIPYKEDITIRMLLSHCAGVFDFFNNIIPENEFSRGKPYVGRLYLEYMMEIDGEHTFTFDELAGVNAENRLSDFEPGESSSYSNTGYSMLGKIIERVSGKSYAEFIIDELAVPNGLSLYLPSEGWDRTLPEPSIEGFVWEGEESCLVAEYNLSADVGGGNIITSPLDTAIWSRKLLRGEAGLDRETVAMMKEKDLGDFGLGLEVLNPGGGYGHSGAQLGYLTFMYYFPRTDVAYVVFTNIWDLSGGVDSVTAQGIFIKEIAEKILLRMGYFHYSLENHPG